MTVKFKVINRKEFENKIKTMSEKTLANLKKTVRVTANGVRNTAIKSIVQNSRAGSEVKRSNPPRTIRISKEGDPPASDTGFLAICAANLPTAAEVDPAQTDDNYPQDF